MGGLGLENELKLLVMHNLFKQSLKPVDCCRKLLALTETEVIFVYNFKDTFFDFHY